MALAAGKLRQQVKIFKKTTQRSATGAVTAPQWEHILTLWANFEPMSGKDVIAAQAAGTKTVARCQLRYRTDIDSSMRLEHRGHLYEITGEPLADNQSGLEYMTLMLERVT